MFALDQIVKEPVVKPPRMIISGDHKTGKSTLATQAPNPIFITVDKERGVDELPVHKIPNPVKNWGELSGWLEFFINQDHPYKTVVIDSGTTLEANVVYPTAMQYEGVTELSKLGGGYGRGNDTAFCVWFDILTLLDRLVDERNIMPIIISHVEKKNVQDPKLGEYSAMKIPLKYGPQLCRWADVSLYCWKDVRIDKEKEGFGKEVKTVGTSGALKMTCTKDPAHDGGGRSVYGHLPVEMPLNFDAFWGEAKKVRESMKGGEK